MSFLLPCNNQQYWKIASSLRYWRKEKKQTQKGQNHCLNKLVDVVYNQ